MQLSLPSVFLLLAAVVSAAPRVQTARQAGCSEASRFGVVSITPSTVAPGDVRASSLPAVDWNTDGWGQTLTIKADFSCSFNFDINPTFTDYYIEVPANNNGHEPPILLARRQPNVSPASPIDQFTVQVSLLRITRLPSLELYISDPIRTLCFWCGLLHGFRQYIRDQWDERQPRSHSWWCWDWHHYQQLMMEGFGHWYQIPKLYLWNCTFYRFILNIVTRTLDTNWTIRLHTTL